MGASSTHNRLLDFLASFDIGQHQVVWYDRFLAYLILHSGIPLRIKIGFLILELNLVLLDNVFL